MFYECQTCSRTAAFCSRLPGSCCTRCDHRPAAVQTIDEVQFDIDMAALYRLRAEITSHRPDFPPRELDIWEMTFDLIWDDIAGLLNNWPTDDKAATQIADWKTLNRRKRVRNLLEQIGNIA
jgi:hypothetical protein